MRDLRLVRRLARSIGPLGIAGSLLISPSRGGPSNAAGGEEGRREALRAVAMALSADPSVDAFDLAIRTARLWGCRRECTDLVVGSLSSADQEVRLRALLVVRTLGIPSANAAVAALLRDPEPDVRFVALETLVCLRAKDQAEAVAALLGEEGFARPAVLSALGRLGEPSAAGRIAPFLADPDAKARLEAALALGRLRARDHLEAMLALLADADAEVRRTAVRSASLIGDPAAAGRIAPLLADPDDILVELSIGALVALGAKEHAGEVAALTVHGKAAVRYAALHGLAELGGRPQIPASAGLLEDPDACVQLRAAEVTLKLAGVAIDVGDPPDPRKVIEQAKVWWTEHRNDPELALRAAGEGLPAKAPR